MLLLGKNYPKVIYDIATFEFGNYLAKTKEKRGLFAYLPPSQNLRGGGMQNGHHHCVQWVKLPQIHILDAQQMRHKFKVNLNLNSNSNWN